MQKTTSYKQLYWQCRRGMLETDILLQRFLKARFDHFSEDELQLFRELLENNDQVLYNWFTGHVQPEDKFAEMVARIRQYDDASA